jgi:peptide deformylase
VERAAQVRVSALDLQGQARTIDAEGLLAVCVQHEMDHLMGKVFVEYLSGFKQSRIRTKLQKQLKDAQRPARR